MNYLDFLIAVPLVWGAWKGYKRGLVFELAMIIGMILGFYLAFKFSGLFQKLVNSFITSSGAFLPYLTFFIVFISVILIMMLLARFLEQVLKIGSLTTLNQVLGALFGLIKAGLMVSVVLSLLRPVDARMELFPAKVKSASLLYMPVLQISHYLFPAIDDIRHEFRQRVG